MLHAFVSSSDSFIDNNINDIIINKDEHEQKLKRSSIVLRDLQRRAKSTFKNDGG